MEMVALESFWTVWSYKLYGVLSAISAAPSEQQCPCGCCDRRYSSELVAEDDAVRISKVVLEDLAGKLQWFAVVYRVLVGIVVVSVVFPDNAGPV